MTNKIIKSNHHMTKSRNKPYLSTSTCLLNTSRDGNFTTSLSSLYQCLSCQFSLKSITFLYVGHQSGPIVLQPASAATVARGDELALPSKPFSANFSIKSSHSRRQPWIGRERWSRIKQIIFSWGYLMQDISWAIQMVVTGMLVALLAKIRRRWTGMSRQVSRRRVRPSFLQWCNLCFNRMGSPRITSLLIV